MIDLPFEEVTPVDKRALELSRSFVHSQPMIDMYTLTEMIKIGIPLEFSTIAIQQLGNNLASALALGYIEALSLEMDWIKGLIRQHNPSADGLDSFLTAYAKSVDTAMGEEGQSISDWLRSQVNG